MPPSAQWKSTHVTASGGMGSLLDMKMHRIQILRCSKKHPEPPSKAISRLPHKIGIKLEPTTLDINYSYKNTFPLNFDTAMILFYTSVRHIQLAYLVRASVAA